MCFNALISNIDDHPRNHAIISHNRDGNFPRYDFDSLMPISIEHRDLAMSGGDAGRFANASNLLSQSARFLLREEQAISMIQKWSIKLEKCIPHSLCGCFRARLRKL